MAKPKFILSCLVVLIVGAVIPKGLSQNIEQLLEEFLKHKSDYDKDFVSDFLDYLSQQNYNDIEEYIKYIQKITKKLWTENLQNSSNLTVDCINSVEDIIADPFKLLHLIDASGKPGAGILGGNLIMSAAFDECFDYNYTGYCMANGVMLDKINTLPWKIGLCVPKYCSNTDIAVMINATGELWVNESTVLCSNSKSPSFDLGAIVMIVVSFIFVVLVLVATVIDIIAKEISECIQNNRQETSSKITQETEKMPLVISTTNNSNNNLLGSHKTAPLSSSSNTNSKVRPLDFVKAFSLFQTVPMLLSTNQGPSVITSLNGLRVISMFWVILGHVYGNTSEVDNIWYLGNVFPRFSFQPVINAYFCVDSFFFLSGVLVAYLTLREMNKRNGGFPFLHYYFHRYLRLTPTYAFIIFFAMFLGRHLSVGPYMTLHDPYREACSKYWWTNLLYINNLYPWKLDDECFGWSWYLANDMQFYVIAPLVLITAYYFLPVSLVIICLLLGSGFIVKAVLTGIFDFQPNHYSFYAYGYVSRPNVTQAYNDVIYNKPWDRISPYIVGLALGYVLYRNLKFDYNKVLNILFHSILWIVAGITAFWLVYGLYFTWHGHIPHTAENVIYIMLGRFLWACCLAFIVFACHNGYGWVINSFLSMKLWTPLARMTFSAYLLNPVIGIAVFGQFQTATHYTDITFAVYFLACVVLAYSAAALLCVFVEFPLASVEMLIFKMFGGKNRESQRRGATEVVNNGLTKA